MKTKIAMVVLTVLVVLGAGHLVSARGRGYPFCVTRLGSEPMASPYAVPGTRCFIQYPETGYRVWGVVRIFF
jgi:hypothetical protein